MSSIKILLVDDHPVVREGLRKMLEIEDDMEIVGEAGDGQEAITQAEVLSPDIVLMDIKMPHMSGIESIRQLKQRNRVTNIIVLTFYGQEYLTQAIGAGAVGYLLKDSSRDELIYAIRSAYEGQSPLDPSLSRDLFNEFATLARGNNKRLPLSRRELEILQLVSSGTTNKEIASQLFLSETTVKRGVRSIFEKFGVKDRAQAVSEAYKQGLL